MTETEAPAPQEILVERRRPLGLPADDLLRRALPEFWDWFEREFGDGSHPLTGPILREIARRWSYLEWVRQTDRQFSESGKLVRVNRELNELLALVTWEPDRDEVKEQIIERLIRDRVRSPSDARRMANEWNKGKGRTASRRPLAVRALEMKMLNPTLTWSAIATQLRYPAGQGAASQNLQAEVRNVKQILRDYGLYRDRRQPSNETPRKK